MNDFLLKDRRYFHPIEGVVGDPGSEEGIVLLTEGEIELINAKRAAKNMGTIQEYFKIRQNMGYHYYNSPVMVKNMDFINILQNNYHNSTQ